MELKITYIITALDKSKQINDPRYLNILLDEFNCIPSISIKAFLGNDEEHYLKQIHDSYLKYHFEYVTKSLVGFRKTGYASCEVVYMCSVDYLPDIVKSGSFYNLSEIQDSNILIEEYYGECFFKFGAGTFRH